MGICMDVNNYRFQSPWEAYEFANHVLDSQTPLVVMSNAWLTHIPPEALFAEKEVPDSDTLVYWAERFRPLQDAADSKGTETMVVIANRVGSEGGANYAGTSCVIKFSREKVEILNVCGRGEERIMVVDFKAAPKFTLTRGG
jgi:protein N-terminal amidase